MHVRMSVCVCLQVYLYVCLYISLCPLCLSVCLYVYVLIMFVYSSLHYSCHTPAVMWPCGRTVQSNLSYLDSCYPGTSLNRAADSLYFMLILQKLWTVQWVWPTIAYIFVLYSEIRTTLSYRHPLIPRCPDKGGFTV